MENQEIITLYNAYLTIYFVARFGGKMEVAATRATKYIFKSKRWPTCYLLVLFGQLLLWNYVSKIDFDVVYDKGESQLPDDFYRMKNIVPSRSHRILKS